MRRCDNASSSRIDGCLCEVPCVRYKRATTQLERRDRCASRAVYHHHGHRVVCRVPCVVSAPPALSRLPLLFPSPHQWARTDMRMPTPVRVVAPPRPSSNSRHKSHVSNRLRALARTLSRPCERTARAGSGVGTRPPRARAARAATGNARGGGGKPSPTLGDALPWPLARRAPAGRAWGLNAGGRRRWPDAPGRGTREVARHTKTRGRGSDACAVARGRAIERGQRRTTHQ